MPRGCRVALYAIWYDLDVIMGGWKENVPGIDTRKPAFFEGFYGPPSSTVVNLASTLGGKWLDLLSEIAPGLKRAAIMFNPDVCRSHSARREAGRSPSATVDNVRDGREPQDRRSTLTIPPSIMLRADEVIE